jgi:type II secretory pathway pseudopilin PulG
MEFGAPFLAVARLPLVTACERFKMNLVGDGVRLLSASELRGALTKALAAAALAAKAKVALVEAIAPMAELEGIARRVEVDHEIALGAVRRDDHTVTVFAMPQDAKSPTVHLSALAVHFARDKDIAAALEKLAADVADWESMLETTAGRLDGDGRLQASLKRAKAVRTGLIGGALAIVAAVVIVTGVTAARAASERKARADAEAAEQAAKTAAEARIAQVLAAADPCTPPDVDDADKARVTPEQQGKLAERVTRCTAARAKVEQEAYCTALAGRVERHETIADDGKLGPAAALLTRVSTKTLHLPDLMTDDAAMPCAGTKGGEALWRAFAKASGDAILLWTKVEAMSPRVAKVLVAEKAVTEEAKRALTFQIERVATEALRKPTPENLARAEVLCGFKADLGLVVAMSCRKAVP